MTITSSATVRLRTILVTLIPALIISTLVTWFVSVITQSTLNRESQRFGNTIADQLAITSADYIVNQDALSLNITLRDLSSQGEFKFAAIHDAERNLIAQVGKADETHLIFTRDVTLQNTLVGHLRLGLKPNKAPVTEIIIATLIIFFALGAGFGVVVWSYGDLFFSWIIGTDNGKNAKRVQQEIRHQDICCLIIKIKPDRLIEAHRDRLANACLLYSGRQETHGDDIMITFSSGQHIQNSICCALLIKHIAKLIPGKLSFKAGLDIGENEEAIRKHAAYLAGISEQQLLVSRRIYQHQDGFSENIQLVQAHHPLVGDGEVFTTEESDTLISNQALKLCES